MRSEAVLAGAAVLFVASAVFASYSWIKKGLCADFTVSAAAALVSLIGAVILSVRISSARNAKKRSEDPIYLVMISGPEEKEQKKVIKAKMPDH